MGKSTIRKKKAPVTLLGDKDDPTVFGVPMQAYQMEKVCRACFQGVMRVKIDKAGRMMPGIAGADGQAQSAMHTCSVCGMTEALQLPPWPRPNMVPTVDIDAAAKLVGKNAATILGVTGDNLTQMPGTTQPVANDKGADETVG